jgi:NtrC-family two-component system sensor histidine kinase KinB
MTKNDDELPIIIGPFNAMSINLSNRSADPVLFQKQMMYRIIEQMQEPIIGLNEMQEIWFVNTAAESLLNLKKNISGQPEEEFTTAKDLIKLMVEANMSNSFKMLLNEKEVYFQVESQEITIPDEYSQLNNAGGARAGVAGRVYKLRNITAFKERDKLKTNLIAAVTHELKTPICSMKLCLKLLEDMQIGPVNKKQTEFIEHFKSSCERLLKMILELIDLSKMETGNIHLSPVLLDPIEIVNYAISAVKFIAQQKRIQIQVNAQSIQAKVKADMEKTAWVLVNFLSNALRYSSENSKVTIEIQEKGNEIIFAVRDFGKGIAEIYQKRLFESYFQVPGDSLNEHGSGLGLTISKYLVEAQQGNIWLQSAIGKGSTFYFSLPTIQ